jgi:hypothetical protein
MALLARRAVWPFALFFQSEEMADATTRAAAESIGFTGIESMKLRGAPGVGPLCADAILPQFAQKDGSDSLAFQPMHLWGHFFMLA